MANQAKVTSIDALERFRANLIIFRTKARRALDTAIDECRRTGVWLQQDRRMHWEGEIRRRRKVLEQAEADLYSARLTGMQESAAVKRAAVNKARHALEEAETRLKNVKRWNQRFGTEADQLLKRLEPLRQIVDHDMPDGISFLVEAQKSLQAYTDVRLADSAPTASPASEVTEEQPQS